MASYDLSSQIATEKGKLKDGIRQIDVALREKQTALDSTESSATSRVAEIQDMVRNYEKKIIRDVIESRSKIVEKAMEARRTLESDLLKLNCIEGIISVTPRPGSGVSNQLIDVCDVDSIVNDFKRIPINLDGSLTKGGYETVDAMLGRLNIITPAVPLSPRPVMPAPTTPIPVTPSPRLITHADYEVFTSQAVHVTAPTPKGPLGLQQINEATVDHYICHMTSTPEGGLVTANYNGEDIFLYDSQLARKSQIRMEWYCWGVACDNFGCLYIATGSDLRRYRISGMSYECSAVDKSPFTLGVYEVFIKGNRIYIGGEKFIDSYALIPVNSVNSPDNDKAHIIDTKDKESFNVGGHVTAISANNQGHIFGVTDKNNLYMFRRVKESDGWKTIRDKLTFSVLVTLKGVVCPDDSCVLLMGSKDERSVIGWQSTVWTVPITQRGLLPAIPLLKLDERIKACALTNLDTLVLATVDSSNCRRLRVYRVGHEDPSDSKEYSWGSTNVFLPSPRPN